ncbi:MAG: hypothetical protein JWQ71_1354 [Pedosphaera sp.]|nr:hypothetical protein [Pedosphaera sp.]
MRNVPTLEQFRAIVTDVRSQKFNRDAKDSADFLEFLGLAGLGQAEASALIVDDVDWGRERLRIRRQKTSAVYFVPIYHHLRPFLEKLLQELPATPLPEQKVFNIQDGKKALAAACLRLKYKKFTQRNLRQILIRRLWQSGVDYKLISKWQGHQDGGKLILDTYTEVFGDDDAEYEKSQLSKVK